MRPTRRFTPAAAVLPAALFAASCASAQAPSAAPPAPTPPAAAEARADAGRARGHTEADARFLRDMIVHHAQALEMARLVPGRAARPEVRTLAERIRVSQVDEIEMMRRWLREHGETAPEVGTGGHEGHGGHAEHGTAADHAPMAGMATPEEMARLAALTGADFDRRFLELMIRHHEGALEMVERLFATPGAAREPALYQLAADVDADQRAEIARMQRLLQAGPRAPQR